MESERYDLEVSTLSKHYGPIHAVDEISFTIPKGEFVILLGPSGCGKTTTLRMIAGLEPQTSGSIFIQGKCMDAIPAYRRNTNTVFQNYSLFPHMNVFDNVAFGLNIRGIKKTDMRNRVMHVLEKVRLPGFGMRRPHELSGGQQQRIALARALVNSPAILLLDEPLGALDLKLRKEMQLELKRMQRDVNITFVYVTHDQEEALTLADRIIIMRQGKIEQIGTPQDVYERPHTQFIADFIGTSNFLDGAVTSCLHGEVLVVLDQLQEVRCSSHAVIPIGKRVQVSVRPEKLLLSKNPQHINHNSLSGIVDEIIYRGAKVDIFVQLPSHHTLRSESDVEDVRTRGFRRGDVVSIKWNSRDCHLFLLP